MREFNFPKNPFDSKDKAIFFKKKKQIIQPGLTVLVGCNGYGKSTYLQIIEEELIKNKIPVMFYDDRHDGNYSIEESMLLDNYSLMANEFCSSEGERIKIHIGKIAQKMGMLAKKQKTKEIWVLLDAIDSGLSIDNVIEFKDFIYHCLIPDMKKNKTELYIVVSANEFELAYNENCKDIYTGKDIKFTNYDQYKEFILKTNEIKNMRYD